MRGKGLLLHSGALREAFAGEWGQWTMLWHYLLRLPNTYNPSPCAEIDSWLWMDVFCFAIIFLESLTPLCISEICIYVGVWIYSSYPKHYTYRKSTNIALLCINSWHYLARKSDVFHWKLEIETMGKGLKLNHLIYSPNPSGINLG